MVNFTLAVANSSHAAQEVFELSEPVEIYEATVEATLTIEECWLRDDEAVVLEHVQKGLGDHWDLLDHIKYGGSTNCLSGVV